MEKADLLFCLIYSLLSPVMNFEHHLVFAFSHNRERMVICDAYIVYG